MSEKSTKGSRSPSQVVAGLGLFAAAIVLFVSGVVIILQGIIAVVNDKVLGVVPPDYPYGASTSVWGWFQIVWGVLVVVVAVGLFTFATWARVSAIVIASLSIVAMFLWIPHSPVWAIVVIALDIFAIWAVATWEDPQQRTTSDQAHSVFDSLGVPALSRPPWAGWPASFAGFPSCGAAYPTFGGQPIRLEDEMKDDRYEIRAELPGIDPVSDVDISAQDGVLTIKARRKETTKFNGHSEFAYGSLLRMVPLPPGADHDDITATYDKGILTVSIGLSAAGQVQQHIPVRTGT